MKDKLLIKHNSDLFEENEDKIDFIMEIYSIINHNTFIIESFIDKNRYNRSKYELILKKDIIKILYNILKIIDECPIPISSQ